MVKLVIVYKKIFIELSEFLSSHNFLSDVFFRNNQGLFTSSRHVQIVLSAILHDAISKLCNWLITRLLMVYKYLHIFGYVHE